MGSRGFHCDAAVFFQIFGIGKGNAGNAGSMTAGIDADEEFPSVGIAVKFVVELLHHGERLAIVQKRVHYLEIRGKGAGVFQVFVEMDYFLAKGFHCFTQDFFRTDVSDLH